MIKMRTRINGGYEYTPQEMADMVHEILALILDKLPEEGQTAVVIMHILDNVRSELDNLKVSL